MKKCCVRTSVKRPASNDLERIPRRRDSIHTCHSFRRSSLTDSNRVPSPFRPDPFGNTDVTRGHVKYITLSRVREI